MSPPRLPELESNQVRITSSPMGAEVVYSQIGLEGLSLSGRRLQSEIRFQTQGRTPATFTRGKQSVFLVLLPGYKPARLILSSPEIYHVNLQPEWPGYAYLGPLHWGRTHPWLVLAILFLAVALFHLADYYRASRRWWEQARLRQKGIEPGVELGGYEVERLLGQGGMGRVLRARNLVSSEIVAIKVLFEAASLDPEWRERFRHEIDALRRLHHPNIVLILDYGEVDGQVFLVQEYLEGETLEQAWQTSQSWAQVAPVAAQIIEALTYLHQQGWVHRDLKPANLMLLPDGRLKLLDFGISTPAAAQTSSIRGTPGYMAPEQFSQPSVDWRADLYSLGALLYEALMGQPLFPEAPHVVELMRLHLEEPAPPIPLDRAPVEVAQFIARLLAKSPQQRFRDSTEFLEAYQQLISPKGSQP